VEGRRPILCQFAGFSVSRGSELGVGAEAARAIRPVLESFLRVASPERFPAETQLGTFRNLCQQRVGTADEILSEDDTEELANLIEYGNRFHHDTNPAWETEVINDGELRGFVSRTLTFASR
jgi:hypothetical protein